MKYNHLGEALTALAQVHDRGIYFVVGSNEEHFLPYADLYKEARQLLGALQQRGLRAGDELVIQLDDNQQLLEAFWACLLGGIIPVPLELAQRDETRLKVLKVWSYLKRPQLISTKENYERAAWAKQSNCDHIIDRHVFLEELKTAKVGALEVHNIQSEDIAFIQFSSGSTGDPKGVVLTHANLLANIEAILDSVNDSEVEERALSWMPLTHDMGMIGMHLSPLVKAWPHFIMPSSLFVRSPNLWLSKIAEHKITLTASPNFGYRFAMRYFDKEKQANLDLSSLRGIINGAEPISMEVCQAFAKQMKAYGLKEEVITPVYGLAEASLAVTFTPMNEKPEALYLSRNNLNTGEQVLITEETPESIAIVKVGTTVLHTQLRIVDEKGEELEEERIGYIHIKGANVCQGYYNNLAATAKVIDENGWLNTGDLGCIIDGELYITGRAKEIIFVNGQNYYPHDLERLAESVEGVGLGKIVIAAYHDAKAQREKVLAFLLFKSKKQERFLQLADQCRQHLSQQTGIEIDQFIPIRKVPKTTSGKVQRFQLCNDYQEGHFDDTLAALAQLRNEQRAQVPTAPLNASAQKLQAIWQKVFDLPLSTADTFHELGGNSLKAGQIIGLVQEQFGVELPVHLFFAPLSIPALAQYIDSAAASTKLHVAPLPTQAFYPLSSVQRRLFYQWQLDKEALNYNLPFLLSLDGPLDIDRLQSAYAQLIQEHEALRTAFTWHAGEAVQTIANSGEVPFKVLQVSEAEAAKIAAAQLQPFDLAKAPLCRARLLQLNDHRHLLFLDFHHIAMDGISVSLFLKALFERYQGQTSPAPAVDYKEYVHWEQQWVAQDQYLHQAAFWKTHFEGEVPVLQLNTDKARPSLWTGAGARIPFELSKADSQQLRLLAQQEQVSPALLFLALYTVLLGRYAAEEDIVVGIPVAGRSHPAFTASLGMFVNNLALRSQPKATDSFRNYLRELRKRYIDALDRQHYLFEDLVNILQARRSPDRNLVFDTMFLFQNMELPNLKTSGLEVQRMFFDPGTAKYDLSMEVFPTGDTFYYELEYATSLFEAESIAKMGQHFQLLVAAILRQPDQELAQLDWLEAQEKERLLHQVNPPVEKQEPSNTLVNRFDQTAKGFANHTALIAGEKTLSYQELNRKANTIARQLKAMGLETEDRVVLMMENSIDLIIGLLGILKAGGAFVPIDTKLPSGRQQFMLDDSEARFVISNAQSLEAVPAFFDALPSDQLLLVDYAKLEGSTEFTPMAIAPEQLAYMIYTSGTTGQPKGVMIEHRNIVNYLDWATKEYIREGALFSPLFTSIAFDLTITAVFAPLLSGNTLMICDQGTADESLQEIFENGAVGLVKLTPSHLQILDHLDLSLPKTCRPLCLVVGGEALGHQLAQRIIEKLGGQVDIYNEYGPTETTVGCTVQRFEATKEQREFVPIGRPIANTQVYVLNEAMQLVPQGVSGELYIAGAGLGRGYWKRAQLTADKFIAHPFAAGERMYRSGDRARWLNDWTLDFQGRKDKQVKIRGYRIELEEISQQLNAHPDVEKAVVLAQQDRLLAYFVGSADLDSLTLEAWLRKQLPIYMIPQQWVSLEQLPLTLHGKVDAQALLAITPKPQRDHQMPSTETERVVTQIFEHILQQEGIGVKEDFYALGGDSIKAVQLATALRGAGLRVQAKDVLQFRTIEQISYEAGRLSEAAALAQEPLRGKRSLHPIENWFFDQEFEHPEHYNQSVLLEFKNPVDSNRLAAVFEQLIHYYDGLRSNYSLDERVAFYNPVHLDQAFELAQFDLRQEDSSAALEQLKVIGEEIKSQFDLESGLLIKAALFHFSEGVERLLITAHHLIIDGISWRILLTDFHRLYKLMEIDQSPKFPVKTAAMRDWLTALGAQKATFETAVDYWQDSLNTSFALPFDQFVQGFYEKNKAILRDHIDAETVQSLKKNIQAYYKADLLVALSLALGLSLKDWTGQSRLIIEMENHGRHLEELDVSGTIGWFTAIYPLYLELKTVELSQQLIDVKEQIRKVPDHGIGYGLYFQTYPSTVRLNYLGEFMEEADNELFRYQLLDTGRDISSENHMTAPISLNAMIIKGALQIDIEYSTALFKASSIEQFKTRLFDYLQQITEQLEAQHTIHLSPSDFDAVELDAGDLETLFS